MGRFKHFQTNSPGKTNIHQQKEGERIPAALRLSVSAYSKAASRFNAYVNYA